MFIKQQTTPPTRVYRVVYERISTQEEFYIHVEATHAAVASESVMNVLGSDYDLIKCIAAKASELN